MTAVPSLSADQQHLDAAAARRRRRVRALVRTALTYAALLAIAALFLMPFLWMLSTSLKPKSEVYLFPPTLLPADWRFDNYLAAWTYPRMDFSRWTLNSLIITGSVMVGTLLSSSLCAYGFARIRFPGRDFWFVATLASVMLPPQVTLIPLYILFLRLNWLDTFLPLTVPTWFGGGAINIFLLRQFFLQIPQELDDAAYIDGASRLQTWWRVYLPLSLPGLLTVAIFTFQNTWGDFYGPLIYLRSQDSFTLALGMNLFRGVYNEEIHFMMAVAVVMTIPMLVLFFLAQRLFIRGIVLTGINR